MPENSSNYNEGRQTNFQSVPVPVGNAGETPGAERIAVAAGATIARTVQGGADVLSAIAAVVRGNPAASLAVAAVLGFVIGRMAR
jgi:hypothetical protein